MQPSDGFKKHADKDFIGTRTINSDGSRGEFIFKTYREFFELINHFASGLSQLNLSPGDRVGIYSINCEEWIAAENACYFNSLVVVSLYDTLGPDAAQFIVRHAGTSVVIVSKEVYPKVPIPSRFEPRL
jgi:long-chain acyl-CoA synthetase